MNGEETSLKGLIQSLVPDTSGIFQATVISTTPLKLQAVNDAKLIIPDTLLILPPHLTDYSAEVNIFLGDGKIESETEENETDYYDQHIHKLKTFELVGGQIIIKNALKVEEKVHVLPFNKGKKYYILDRVV